MMKPFRTFVFFAAIMTAVICLGAAFPATASAQGSGVGQRMRERLPAVDSLKVKGLVGENNEGYLSPRQSLSAADSELVTSENADRALVYEAIAGKTGTDATSVGRARAEQIASRSASGVWIQDASGKWYRK